MSPPASPTRKAAVFHRLSLAIVRGDLTPGEAIRETELAHRLGVSATPVREALGDLAAEGLIEVEVHRGRRVAPIDPGAMADLLRVQAALWRMGYVWGLPRLDEDDVAALERSMDGYEVGLAAGDRLGSIRAAHDFHAIVIAASGSAELLRVTLDRRALIARFILLRARTTVSPSGLRQHRAILSAIRRRDPDQVLARLDEVSARLIAAASAGQENGRA